MGRSVPAQRSDMGCTVTGSRRLAYAKPIRPGTRPTSCWSQTCWTSKVPELTQTNFVHMLHQTGEHADQLLVQATDDDRHGVIAYAGCLRGASIQEIARELDLQVAKRLTTKTAMQAQPQMATAAVTAAASRPSTSGGVLTARQTAATP